MDDDIFAIGKQIEELKRKLSEARRARPPEPVADYQLKRRDGSVVRLSELFGDHQDLIVIHNMGKGCAYCTMWADGFTGMAPHIQNRSAFAVVSPDSPSEQSEFADGRGWTFPMYSGEGSTFLEDMGYKLDDGYWPGISAFHRNADGSIERTGRDFFGPGDDYCPPWRMFDLLKGGPGEWEPQFQYGSPDLLSGCSA